MTDPRSDPFWALSQPITPVDPDPAFAAELRSRLERALLAPEGSPMTTTFDAPAHTLGSYIAVNDARSALDFYERAFGARRRGEPIVMADGRIGHAELAIGDSVLMLADEFAEIGLLSPRTRGGPSQSLYLRVSEAAAVDAIVHDAVEAGARLERPAADQPYGRNAVVVDPSGHRWMIASSPAAAPTPRRGDLAYLTYAVADSARARAFYGAVLGWAFVPGRVEDGWQIEGTNPPAGLHGGAAQPGIEPVYQVDDLAAALAAVRDHGGQAGEPQQQPYGRIAQCVDNQGTHFQLLES
ncbi:MAG: VOC family protein [Actinomycetota bacterium]|nr:VOC family protein [Actinomycetota bacterium]